MIKESYLVGGFSPPPWKIWTSVGMMKFPIYGKIENVPNHQPEKIFQQPTSAIGEVSQGALQCGWSVLSDEGAPAGSPTPDIQRRIAVPSKSEHRGIWNPPNLKMFYAIAMVDYWKLLETGQIAKRVSEVLKSPDLPTLQAWNPTRVSIGFPGKYWARFNQKLALNVFWGNDPWHIHHASSPISHPFPTKQRQ